MTQAPFRLVRITDYITVIAAAWLAIAASIVLFIKLSRNVVWHVGHTEKARILDRLDWISEMMMVGGSVVAAIVVMSAYLCRLRREPNSDRRVIVGWLVAGFAIIVWYLWVR